MIEFTLDFHHQEKHVVVGPPGKEDLAGIKLVEGATD
jgi:hypothetical protein